jgi:PAS domain S-box-containing protein
MKERQRETFMVSARILLVTGDSAVAHDLHARLKKLGYKVVGVTAYDEEVPSKLEQFKPDLVLTDIRQASGGETKTGKLIQTKYNLPVIFVTGNIGQATIQRARPTGPFGYIYQPFDDQQLLVTIETALTRHQWERKLRESRQWLNTTLTSIGDGVIATDENGFVRFINPAAIELTGWRHVEAIHRQLHEVFRVSDEESRQHLTLAAIEKRGKTDFETIMISRSQRSIPVEANATLITGEKGETLGMVLVFRDVTEQRNAMLEIQHQVERAETLLQVASQINTEIELQTVLRTICEAATRTLKSTGAAILLKDSKRDIYRSVAVSGEPRLVESFRGSQVEASVAAFRSFTNAAGHLEGIMEVAAYPDLQSVGVLKIASIQTIAMVPLLRQGNAIGILLSFFSSKLDSLPEDERKLIRGLADQAGIAIANASSFEKVRASRERQQFLSRRLVKVQEDERRSLARELHDEIGQMLTGLQFTLKPLMAHATEEERSRLDQAQIIVSAIISQIRELSINLRPSLLDDLGILPTLEWYFNRYEAKTGIEVHFEYENLAQRFHTELETAAFRIVQEALTNVARYAETATVDVRLDIHDSVMYIDVRDQGRGFDMAGLAKDQSLGIEGMRERAYALGGLLEIQSEPGKGTHIQANLPVAGRVERRIHERDYTPGR